ncbi:MAG: hypothetical protein ACYDCK_14795, partial [Thermoplasmatota archaeon]
MPPVGSGPVIATDHLDYHGGSIEKVPKVYLVFWGWLQGDPTGQQDPDGEAKYITDFFSGVGGSGWANIQTQYSETARGAITNPTSQLGGVWYDNDPVDTVYSVHPQGHFEQVAQNAEAHFGFDPDATYFILTWHKHNDPCFLQCGWCAYHSTTIASDGHTIAWTNMPYMSDGGGSCGQNFVNGGNAGKLDGVSIVAGHEYAEAVTDPHLDAWWSSASGGENGDLCAWYRGPGGATDLSLSTGSFAVQGLWSNAINGCAN